MILRQRGDLAYLWLPFLLFPNPLSQTCGFRKRWSFQAHHFNSTWIHLVPRFNETIPNKSLESYCGAVIFTGHRDEMCMRITAIGLTFL